MPAPISPVVVAPVTSAPAGNGVQTSARNTSGQFAPKDGATGKAPVETKAPPADPKVPGAETKGPPGETAAEKAYRLRTKLRRKGQEVDVDLDEEGIKRALQVGWDLEAQRGEIAADRKAVNELLHGLKNKTRETLRSQGVDIDELVANEAAEQQKLEAMTEVERENYALKKQLADLDAQRDTEKKTAAEQLKVQQRREVAHRNVTSYRAALKASGLPESPRLLNAMISTQELITSAGRPPLEPTHLAQATERRHLLELKEVAAAASSSPEAAQRWAPALREFAKLGLGGLKGKPLLDALGKDLVLSVCEATLEGLGHQVQPRQPGEEPPAAKPAGAAPAMNEYEAREALRNVR